MRVYSGFRDHLADLLKEYELDGDELDELEEVSVVTPTGRGDQNMPLLVGLLHSARSGDGSIPLRDADGEDGPYIDLEDIAAKRDAGGTASFPREFMQANFRS